MGGFSMDPTPDNTRPEESFNLSSYRGSHVSPHVELVAYLIKAFVPREYDELGRAAKHLLEELRPLTDVHTLDRKDIGVTSDVKKCAINLEYALQDLVQRIPDDLSKSSDDVLVRARFNRAYREVSLRGKLFLAAASEV
jgi:hypothetical protein